MADHDRQWLPYASEAVGIMRQAAPDGPGLQTEDHLITKLSDTQAVILGNASPSFDGNVLPLPGSFRGGAQAKVIGALLKRGLIEERTIDSIQPPDAPAGSTRPTRREPRPPACASGQAQSFWRITSCSISSRLRSARSFFSLEFLFLKLL